MTSTLIIACCRCSGLFLAKTEQKTRTCPYCGGRINVEKCRTLGSADSAYEASLILKNLKSRFAPNGRKNRTASR